ncbi:hypothetical protein Tco_0118035 [Tanacetum coccineum]
MTNMTRRGRSYATRGKGTRRANTSQRLVADSQMPVTPPSTLPVPHSSSPAPDSLSPSSLDSQTLVATVKRASSTITNDTQKRGPRGYYLNKNIPKDPSERKPIHIIGPSEYLEACAAISIIKDFKAHFCGTQTEWSKLNDDFVDLLYQCFLDRYQYEETMDPKEARKVWVRRAMERCRGTWAMVRIKCEKKSRSSNKVAMNTITNLSKFYPYLCSGKQSWEIFLLSLTLVDDSLILSQSSSKYSNLEVGRINHRSWVMGNDYLWNVDDFLVTENFGMILGQPVHTDDNIKTTEFNRHEINFERCKILLGMKEISGFKTIDDSGNWGWSKQLACEQ